MVPAGADPHTVNTMPRSTLEAFLDHGVVSRTVDQGVDEARLVVHELAAAGIDVEAVAQQLEEEGIALFTASYEEMLRAIDSKPAALPPGSRHRSLSSLPTGSSEA